MSKQFTPSPPSVWRPKLENDIRGDARDVAAIQGVPVTWVYANAERIPGFVRVGKYLRWDLKEVLAWRGNGR